MRTMSASGMRKLVIATAMLALTAAPVLADLVDHIDPFIGTGAHGHTFPGPTLPFGMVQLSPDTRLTGWDGCSLYHDSDRVVFGFSHTHLSGTGVGDYGDILLMPLTGIPRLRNGYPDRPDEGYGSRFDKADERASAGYYRTVLKDYGIEVELTATERTGLHRYAFPAGESAYVIIDLEHRDKLLDVGFEIVDERTIAGFRRSEGWAHDQLVHFRAVFSQPFTAEIEKGSGENFERPTTAVLTFGDLKDSGGELLVQVGLSAVDAEGARKNLEAEWAGFDFAATRGAAKAAWSAALAPFAVEGASDDELTVMATAIYHSFLAPNLFSDVDGRYRGMDREVHVAEGRKQYTVFSLWDTYRATHPLFTLVQRARTNDFVNTALSHYREGGRLPVWELAGNETDCMIGYHSVSFIADAWLKGIRGFDAAQALEAMVDSGRRDHFGLAAYKHHGFIPADADGESVSKTLEYSRGWPARWAATTSRASSAAAPTTGATSTIRVRAASGRAATGSGSSPTTRAASTRTTPRPTAGSTASAPRTTCRSTSGCSAARMPRPPCSIRSSPSTARRWAVTRPTSAGGWASTRTATSPVTTWPGCTISPGGRTSRPSASGASWTSSTPRTRTA